MGKPHTRKQCGVAGVTADKHSIPSKKALCCTAISLNNACKPLYTHHCFPSIVFKIPGEQLVSLINPRGVECTMGPEHEEQEMTIHRSLSFSSWISPQRSPCSSGGTNEVPPSPVMFGFNLWTKLRTSHRAKPWACSCLQDSCLSILHYVLLEFLGSGDLYRSVEWPPGFLPCIC